MTGSPETSQMVERAAAIVGENPPHNASLSIRQFDLKHIDPLRRFLPESEPLVSALNSPAVRVIATAYEKHDTLAGIYQNAYKAMSWRIPLPVTIAIVLCIVTYLIGPPAIASWVVSLFGRDQAPDASRIMEVYIRQVVPLMVAGGLIGTPLLALFYQPAKTYTHWKEERAAAEASRNELFRRVFASGSEKPGEQAAWPLLLKLEYFRRWQVQVQSAYFKKRRHDHQRSVRWAKLATVAYAVAFVVWCLILCAASLGSTDEQGPLSIASYIGVAPIMSALQQVEQWDLDRWLLLAGLALAMASLGLLYQTLLNSSVRNAARFEIMAQKFREIDQKLPSIRAAAAVGDEKAVSAFVDRIHATMSLELADWVRLADLDLGNESQTAFSDGLLTAPSTVQPSTS